MNSFEMGKYDVIVIGAGHAGCEAGLAAARMGHNTLLLSLNLEAVAMMACNPSIGGTGKGHLVREIDALGGEMGLNIDKSFIQSKMLNTAKGPAVHSLRAQADKEKYHEEMKKTLELQENLELKQAEAVEIVLDGNQVDSVIIRTGAKYRAKKIILATGTFLAGKIFIGEWSYDSGPNNLAASMVLAENLKDLGLKMRRFKTGTPARALGKSFDYSKMLEQPGDESIVPFSFMNDSLEVDQVSCWLTYTNEETHEIIRENFDRSALFGGQIEGVGPRYCPSIEDKVNRFADKARHQLFIEPEGLATDEMYIQGMSSSLPEDVQEKFYRSIAGLENIEIVRPAYAIEYDCIDPTELQLTLEHRSIKGLFCAGQFNGSSGYEEAAAQGLIAGMNASLQLKGEEPFILDRSEAYIGVLIDDLVTKGTNEPYRIMTSRAEYRLVLRQDNADLRLTEKSYKAGLVTEERFEKFNKVRNEAEKERARLENTFVTATQINKFLEKNESATLQNRISLAELLKRPEMNYKLIEEIDSQRSIISAHSVTQLEVQIKYDGYITKQLQQIERFKKLEGRKLDGEFDYNLVEGLRIEAQQKLNQVKPLSLGQASRISGVSPADINVLQVHLEKEKRKLSRKENGGKF